jgi:hypothetical protein
MWAYTDRQEAIFMEYNKKTMHSYVGQWVRCHSVYGVHEGLVHRALHDGIILVHTAQLAAHNLDELQSMKAEPYTPSENSLDMQTVQFFPAPGLFVPYRGIYGIWPRVGFFI